MEKHFHTIDGKSVVIVDDVIDANEIHKIKFFTDKLVVSRSGLVENETKRTLHYAAMDDLGPLKKLTFFKNVEVLLRETFIEKKLVCHRLIYREIVYGDHLEYHTDCTEPNRVTVLMYLNCDWQNDFHGETLFLEPSGIGLSVMPKPGRAVLFDSRVTHCSGTPSRLFYEARKLLVLNFGPAEI